MWEVARPFDSALPPVIPATEPESRAPIYQHRGIPASSPSIRPEVLEAPALSSSKALPKW